MSKGGSQDTQQNQVTQELSTTTIDPALEQGAQAAMAAALKAAGLEYRPNRGVTIAALTPQHQAAMKAANAASAAFGLPTGDMSYVPPPTQTSTGLLGYATGNLYDEMVDQSIPETEQLARRDILDYLAAEGYDVSGRMNPRLGEAMKYYDKRTGREVSKQQYERMQRYNYGGRNNYWADRYEARPYDFDDPNNRFGSLFAPTDPNRGHAAFLEANKPADVGGGK